MKLSPVPVEHIHAGSSVRQETGRTLPRESFGSERAGTPRDRTALYAQAELKGTRYGDYSASRQKIREQFARRDRAHPPPSPEFEEVPARAPQPEPTRDRWQAMQSVLFPTQIDRESENGHRPPTVAVLSLAGGVGKTCLVATLGRALSGLAEEVLLVDMAAFGLLPFYFASREVKPGVLRTFSAPVKAAQRDAPVRLLSLDTGEPDPFAGQFAGVARGASRILVDAGVAHRGLAVRLLSLRPTMLVPILPDMNSLACLAALEDLMGETAEIYYLLNQFDDSLPLHQDVRVMLQQQLGSRLLPLVLHRSPAVSEALAEGLTVIDYAPASQVSEDYRRLAAWLRSLVAPAPAPDGGLRWTER